LEAGFSALPYYKDSDLEDGRFSVYLDLLCFGDVSKKKLREFKKELENLELYT